MSGPGLALVGGLGLSPSSGGLVVQDEGVALPVEPALNFAGAGVTAVDDPGNARITVTIPGGVTSLQGAYDGGETITTDAQGAVDFIRGALSPTGESLVTITDGALAVRTASTSLLTVSDANAGTSTTVRIARSASVSPVLDVVGSFPGTVGPTLSIYYEKAGVAADDAGRIAWDGQNSTPVRFGYGRDSLRVVGSSAGNESGARVFQVAFAGTLSRVLELRATSANADSGVFILNRATTAAQVGFDFVANADYAIGEVVFRVRDAFNASPVTLLEVDGDGNCTHTSTAAGATGVELRLFQSSATPAVSDVPGNLTFYGRDSGAAVQQYGSVRVRIASATAGAEAASIILSVAGVTGGVSSLTDVLTISVNGATMLGNFGAAFGPEVAIRNNAATGANGDSCGDFGFYGPTTTGAVVEYGYVTCYAVTATNGATDARFAFNVRVNNADLECASFGAGAGVRKIGFFGTAAVARPTVGANVNNVVASGTTGQFDDWTNLAVYATDAPAIHATVSQLCLTVAQLTVAVRALGLGA